MLTIVKENQELIVTKGAYNTMYAPQGWVIKSDEIISATVKATPEEKIAVLFQEEAIDQSTEDVTNEPDLDTVDLSEIPLSSMTVEQLKAYAQQLGVEVNSDSARQLRSRIKKVLEG